MTSSEVTGSLIVHAIETTSVEPSSHIVLAGSFNSTVATYLPGSIAVLP